ncbi:AAA ATPase midasin [Quaeritorhiza haematococci]|nr:AAA ATPase midasin [Quaeritorhiza haematococci]
MDSPAAEHNETRSTPDFSFTVNITHRIHVFFALLSESRYSKCVDPSNLRTFQSILKRRFLDGESQSPVDSSALQDVLDLLSELLLHPLLTIHIARIFRSLLIDLVGRWFVGNKALTPKSNTVRCILEQDGFWWDNSRSANEISGVSSKASGTAAKKVSKKRSPQTPKHDRDGNVIQRSADNGDEEALTRTQLMCIAFSFLLPVAPQIRTYAVSMFTNGFSLADLLRSADSEAPEKSKNFCLALVLRSLYRILQFSPETFTDLVDWSAIHAETLNHADPYVCAYSAYIVAIVTRMSDAEKSEFIPKYVSENVEGLRLGDVDAVDGRDTAKTTYEYQSHFLRLVPLIEMESDTKEQGYLFQDWRTIYQKSEGEQSETPASNEFEDVIVSGADLCPMTVDLCGVLLPSYSAQIRSSSPPVSVGESGDDKAPLVLTSTTTHNLHRIALAVSLRMPILLEGPPGSGKTSLVEEVSRVTGRNDLLKIHLGDQTDSKVLLGTYISTSTPGIFKWQPGVLTSAVSEGRWLLIEDIDLAPAEVISVLIPLLEGTSRCLFIPSRGERIQAKEGFQLFATRTTQNADGGRDGKRGGFGSGSSNGIGEGLWNKIQVQPLNRSEVMDVVSHRFSALQRYVPTMIRAFNLICDVMTNNSVDALGQEGEGIRLSGLALGGRKPSLRDLMKWCTRVEIMQSNKGQNEAGTTRVGDGKNAMEMDDGDNASNISMEDREHLFREAADCFAAMIPSGARYANAGSFSKPARVLFLELLGNALGVPLHRVQFYTDTFVPTLSVSDSTVAIGRVALPRMGGKKKNNASSNSVNWKGGDLTASCLPQNFAPTFHALRLLEKIAVSVYLQEPVLLVGETGTGKTSIVQTLEHMLHAQQSTSTKTTPTPSRTRPNLVVLNMSQQSDSSDLLGGFRPVDGYTLVEPLKEEFDQLFSRTFSVKSNAAFLEAINRAFQKRQWNHLCVGFGNAVKMAQKVVKGAKEQAKEGGESSSTKGTDPATKKSRKTLQNPAAIAASWELFSQRVMQLQTQLEHMEQNMLFHFVEGSLVKAVRHGHWVLLDEINLASPETLESISSLLQSVTSSLLLVERGDTTPIPRHPNFRLFACMNPAGDAGKRDLPPGLRSRFTEMWVDPPDGDKNDLKMVVNKYLLDVLPPPTKGGNQVVEDVVTAYTLAKEISSPSVSASASLASVSGAVKLPGNTTPTCVYDGANHRVHFSMRTLARALMFAMTNAHIFGLRRALYEGFVMSFVTQLNKESQAVMLRIIQRHILNGIPDAAAYVKQIPRSPSATNEDGTTVASSSEHILFDCYWIRKGPLEIPESHSKHQTVKPGSSSALASRGGIQQQSQYVLTPSVSRNLSNLARAIVSQRHPILIQGPTSAGKTSMIEYIAKSTGHRFVRINNHEHTDLQEYLGSYMTDEVTGKLVFREGILVEALRKGYWLVLDELNLAPSDVLEALNRLLDDNRELVIPETQTVIRPHPQFMLFATQNPPSLGYAGRKTLSAAFRNRFLELSFDDLPEDELCDILSRRCSLAPSHATKIVQVFRSLRSGGSARHRMRGGLFEGRNGGVVTLRDLFRWAGRVANGDGVGGYQELAEQGYMLLAERIRREDDKKLLQDVIEEVMKVKLNQPELYEREFETIYADVLKEWRSRKQQGQQRSKHMKVDGGDDPIEAAEKLLSTVVWTSAMKRLFVLVYRCLTNHEPCLLVGETGCGKTTVCQILATLLGRRLHIVNAHQNSETADFLGSQRPVRGKDLLEKEVRQVSRKMWVMLTDAKLVDNQEQMAVDNDEEPQPHNSEWWELADLSQIFGYIESLVKGAGLEGVDGADSSLDIRESWKELQKLFHRTRCIFEWNDGPLVQAMKQGDLFLLDEISLADDSVLERLNSVLEPHKLLVLAERGGGASSGTGSGEELVVEEITGREGFEFLATMNPGGDYGKKELSPALRNRFTEIWVPAISSRDDLITIVDTKLSSHPSFASSKSSGKKSKKTSSSGATSLTRQVARLMIDFLDWFASCLKKPRETIISLRDILAWCHFIVTTMSDIGLPQAFVNGGLMVVVDGIGVNPLFGITANSNQSRQVETQRQDDADGNTGQVNRDTGNIWGVSALKRKCLEQLKSSFGTLSSAESAASSTRKKKQDVNPEVDSFDFGLREVSELQRMIRVDAYRFGIHPFYVPVGPYASVKSSEKYFALEAPTTFMNCVRVMRALQLQSKPILLEGPPGVGKTSLISQLAKLTGYHLVRINLSEQTDLMDLFGSDLPVEDNVGRTEGDRDSLKPKSGSPSSSPEFAWCDGPFLRAMQNGDWVLLDELNLASQQVLEGLNACLDHRGAVYIPELDRTFQCSPNFRVFAAQNPHAQGGGRKGLPKSFVNRFTQVYVDSLTEKDLDIITQRMISDESITDTSRNFQQTLKKMVDFILLLHEETMVKCNFGWKGGPWEFNLRDVVRWVELVRSPKGKGHPQQTGLAKSKNTESNEEHYYDPGDFLETLFVQRMRTAEDREHVHALFCKVFGYLPERSSQRPPFHIATDHIQVGNAVLPRGRSKAATTNQLQILQSSLSYFETVMHCVRMNWMTLITGGTASGKSSLVRLLATLTGNRLEEFAMNSSVDTVELLGGFEQVDRERLQQKLLNGTRALLKYVIKELLLLGGNVEPGLIQQMQRKDFEITRAIGGSEVIYTRAQYESVLRELNNIMSRYSIPTPSATSGVPTPTTVLTILEKFGHLDAQDTLSGKFEWIDGTLVRAMEEGHWVLIDNVNFCSPSVLDRLNPLFEPNGILMLNERGLIDGEVKVVRPHPNFRIFMTMDPRFGEISRAMRNRAVEICLLGPEWLKGEQEADEGAIKESEPQRTMPFEFSQVFESMIPPVKQIDIVRIANSMGFVGAFTCDLAISLFETLLTNKTSGSKFENRQKNSGIMLNDGWELLVFIRLLVERLQRGVLFMNAISSSRWDDHAAVRFNLTEHAKTPSSQQQSESVGTDVFSLYQEPSQGAGVFESVSSSPDFGNQSTQIGSLAHFSYPTIWPTFVSGRFWEEESDLARVAWQGSSIQFLLEPKRCESSEVQEYIQPYFSPAAVRYFVENGQASDWRKRLLWLGYMADHQHIRHSKSYGDVVPLAHALILAQRNEGTLLSVVSAISDWHPQVIHIRQCCLRLEVSRFYEERACKTAMTLKSLSEMSCFQRSFWLNSNDNSGSSLSEDAGYLPLLYPLLVALREFLEECIFHLANESVTVSSQVLDAMTQLMERREEVWKSTITGDIDMAQLVVVVRRLQKAWREMPLFPQPGSPSSQHQTMSNRVVELLDRLCSALRIQSFEEMSVLWKHSRAICFRNEELMHVGTAFGQINEMFEMKNVIRVTDWLVHPGLQVASEMKRSIVEGLTTVFFLNESDLKSERPESFRFIQELPERLEMKVTEAIDSAKELLQKAGSSIDMRERNQDSIIVPTVRIGTQLAAKALSIGVAPLENLANIKSEKNLLLHLSEIYMRFLWGSIKKTDGVPDLKAIAMTMVSDVKRWLEETFPYTLRPPSDLEPLQRLVWLCELDVGTQFGMPESKFENFFVNTINDVVYTWLRALWVQPSHFALNILRDPSAVQHVSAPGPSALHDSVGVLFGMHILYPEKLQQLERFRKCLVPREQSHQRDEWGDVSLFLMVLAEYLDAQRKLLGPEHHRTLLEALKPLHDYVSDNLNGTVTTPTESINALSKLESIVKAKSDVGFVKHLIPVIDGLRQMILSGRPVRMSIGELFVRMSLGFIRAYIPDVPVDPAMIATIKLDLLQEKAKLALGSLQVYTRIEQLTTGNSSSFDLRTHRSNVERLSTSINQALSKVAFRPQRSQISSVFNDMNQLQHNILSPQTVDVLVSGLVSQTGPRCDDLQQKETHLQEALTAYVDQLSTKYPSYRDLLQPLFKAIFQLKYGLRLLTDADALSRTDLYETCRFLLRFMDDGSEHDGNTQGLRNETFLSTEHTTSALKQLCNGPCNVTEIALLPLSLQMAMLRKLEAWAYVQGRRFVGTFHTGHRCLSEIADFWRRSEEHRKEAELKKQALFKQRETTSYVPTEEELTEKEVAEVFPTFYAEILEEANATKDETTATKIDNLSSEDADPNEDVGVNISIDDANTIVSLHHGIVAAWHGLHSKGDSGIQPFHCRWSDAYKRSFKIALSVLTNMKPDSIPRDVDAVAQAGLLYMSALHKQSLTIPLDSTEQLSASTTGDDYNFYTDPNTQEALRILPTLKNFDARINQLLELWPEHHVLTELLRVCARIARFSVDSPIMKLLTGLELLLTKCDDWESHASRTVSLKENMQEITSLIIRWRKLELDSWRQLLCSQDREFQKSASRLWVHLYDIVFHSQIAVDSDTKEAESEYLSAQEVVHSLDMFFQSSNLGEFSARLRMLDTFRKHLEILSCESSEHRRQLALMCNVLGQIFNYYSQFEGALQTKIRELRKPIEKELNEYVRLASWKDVNVFALRESAAKTHRHLHKYVRKYRDVLSTPFVTMMKGQNNASREESRDDHTRGQHIEKLNSVVSSEDLMLSKWGALTLAFNQSRDIPQGIKWLPTIEKIHTRLRSFTFDLLTSSRISVTHAGLDDLAGTIVERAKAFQEMNATSEKGSNKMKGQKMLRKKALVDLLKYLHFLGLSNRFSKALEKQNDFTTLCTQPVPRIEYAFKPSKLMPASSPQSRLDDVANSLWTKANAYFYRILAAMMELRQGSLNFNRDLADHEVKRMVSFCEHLLSFIVCQREAISSVLTETKSLLYSTGTLGEVYETMNNTNQAPFIPGHLFVQALQSHQSAIDGILTRFYQAHTLLKVEDQTFTRRFLEQITKSAENIEKVKERLTEAADRYVSEESQHSKYILVPEYCRHALVDGVQVLQRTLDALKTLQSANSPYNFVIEDLRAAVAKGLTLMELALNGGHSISTSKRSNTDNYAEELQHGESLLEAVMISFQDFQKVLGTDSAEENSKERDEFGLDKDDMRRLQNLYLNSNIVRHLSQLNVALRGSVDKANERHQSKAADEGDKIDPNVPLVIQLFPLLHQHLLVIQRYLVEFISWNRTCCKVLYILCKTFGRLFKEGFCVPDEQGDEEGEENLEDNATGTGIGEGEGVKDVSDTIEDQEQVEGMQNEQGESNEANQTAEEKDGIEMDTDFDGQLEDVEQAEGDEEDEGDEEGSELEEAMGEVDDDQADVVDEKMWNDSDEKSDPLDEKKEQDSSTQSHGNEVETVAKQDSVGDNPEEKDSGDNKVDEGDEPPSEEMPQDDDIVNDDAADKHEENHGVDVKDVDLDEKNAQDAEDEFPEDMQLDDVDENSADEDPSKDDADTIDQMDETEDLPDSDPREEDAAAVNQETTEASDGPKEEEEPVENDEEQEEGQDGKDNELADQQHDEPPSDAEDQADKTQEGDDQNVDQAAPTEENQKNDDLVSMNDMKTHSAVQQQSAPGLEGNTDQAMDVDEVENQQASRTAGVASDTNDQSLTPSGQPQDVAEEEATKANESAGDSKSHPEQKRSLGDALERWMEKLRSVLDRAEDSVDDNGTSTEQAPDANSTFRFVGDEEEHDTQMMDTAADDEKLDRPEALAEPQQQEADEPVENEEDVSASEPAMEMESHEGHDRSKVVSGNISMEPDESIDRKEEQTMEVNEEEHDVTQDINEDSDSARRMRPDEDVEDIDGDFDSHEENHLSQENTVNYDEMRQQLEETVARWRESGQDLSKAYDLWRTYCQLTEPLSFELCEQLRLILEPTLATKLKGDYRTGKRLNMRKVIPYIASQYKKDKIWLRRTRPSKRVYQVLIAIDDSKSMAESRCVQLAYESLALITKALTQLEVGDVGVVSFGENVQLLHPFEKPFTEEAGANVIGRFSFAQNRTHVQSMMEATVNILEHARATIGHGTQSADLWQLQIVISDGICENHEQIRRIVRQAAEHRILVLFVVLDNRSEKNSILNMTNVSYGLDNSTGRPTLQLTKYMNTFPFDYYIVLRDIDTLPDVLADTLRQYFMLTGTQ